MIFLCLLTLALLLQSTTGEVSSREVEKRSFSNKASSFLVTQLRPIKVLNFDVESYGRCSYGHGHTYGIAVVVMNVSCPYDEADLCGLHGTKNDKTEVMVVECQYAGKMRGEDGGDPLTVVCYQKENRHIRRRSEDTLCRKWRYPGTSVPQLKLPEHLKSPASHLLFYKPANLDSFSGNSEVNTTCLTRNPHERTGFSGKGKLPQLGPNSALFLLITRLCNGKTKVLTDDTDDYTALPRFWVKKPMIDGELIKRKLLKLNLYCNPSDINIMVQTRQKYHNGYLKDKHNTDNAWVEGAIIHLHDQSDGGCFSPYPIHGKDKSRQYRWQVLPFTTTPRDFSLTFALDFK